MAFASNGNLAGNNGYLFKINSAGKYVRDPAQVRQVTDHGSTTMVGGA